MKIIRTAVSIIALLAIGMSLPGCAIFRHQDLPEVKSFPSLAPGVKKPTASYEFASAVEIGNRRPHPEKIRAELESEFVQVLQESGYLATLEKGSSGKDISIRVDLLNSGDPAALVPAFITGFSLFTIPSWATDNLEASCKVSTADGKTHEYKLKDSTTIVQWLPMMFVFPFKPFTGVAETRKNIYKNLIIKMQEDGILPNPGQPLKTSGLVIRLKVAPAV
jgi:hypothetical protein